VFHEVETVDFRIGIAGEDEEMLCSKDVWDFYSASCGGIDYH
jgi:hypothetical protein